MATGWQAMMELDRIVAPLLAQSGWLSWLEKYRQLDPFHGGGFLTALGLIVALAFLLPRGERRAVREPIVFLVLHVLFLVLHALPEAGYVHIPFEYFALFCLLVSLVRSVFLLCTRSRPARWLFQPLPQIFLDTIQGAAYVGVALITLASAKVEASSLLAGGAVMAALFGFLMKDTLGNLLAGLAIQGERPFEVGDWIQFNPDKSHIGKVLELNWRSTKVLTLDEVEVIVPNSQLALFPIVNFTKPEPWSRRNIYFYAPFDVPTEKVRHLVLDAVRDAWGVLEYPPPSVVTNDFGENGVQYWVRIFTIEFGQRDRVDGGVRDRIWHALHRHGIAIPVAQRDVHLREPESDENLRQRRRRLLRCVDFLAPLSDEMIDELASHVDLRHFATGEVLIQQGDVGDELFIVTSGEVVAQVSHNGAPPVEMARLGPESFFGEMSLMTGQKRTATIVATKGVDAIVINRAALAPILEASPELVNVISQTLESRQAALTAARAESVAASSEAPKESSMLRRVKEFFGLE